MISILDAEMAHASGRMLARQLPLLNVTPISNRGHIMKANHLLALGAAALLPFAAAIAQTPSPQPADQPAQTAPQQSQGASFESLDTNADGRISKTEAAANASVQAQFSSYDLNGDGFIERAEVNKANEPQPPKTPQQP